jgi:hypothetical protein
MLESRTRPIAKVRGLLADSLATLERCGGMLAQAVLPRQRLRGTA